MGKVILGFALIFIALLILVNGGLAAVFGIAGGIIGLITGIVGAVFGVVAGLFGAFVGVAATAFGLAMPSLSRALQKSRGRLLPVGFIHLLRALRRPTQVDFLLVAVLPEYQARGLTALLMAEITANAIKNGIRSAETNPELETNTQVQAIWKHYESRQHKRRRAFIKSLT